MRIAPVIFPAIEIGGTLDLGDRRRAACGRPAPGPIMRA
jgi:hypothetical protein